MRHFIWTAGLLATTPGCFLPQFYHTRTVQQSIEPDEVQVVDLSTYNGSITVEPHEASNIEMEITFKARGNSEAAAKENCEAMECDVTEEDGKVTITATKPPGQWSASASFALKVPPDCGLELNTSNGKVSVKDMIAKVSIKTSNGAIRCESLRGMLAAETSNGAIQVQDSEGSVRLKTSNGKVSYSGRLVGDQNEIRTSNGSVTLAVPSGDLTEVLTKTSNGSIHCDLPTPRVMEESKKSFHAIVGEGEGDQAATKISVRTSNGSIKIEPWLEAPTAEVQDAERIEAEIEGEFVL